MTDIYFKSSVTTICVNTVQSQKIVYLPSVSTIPAGGLLCVKDICGNAATSCIILSTTGYFDTIDYKANYISTFSNINSPSYSILSTNGASAMLMPDGKTNWMVLQNNMSNPIYGMLGYSSFLYTYFYNLFDGSSVLCNNAPYTSPLGPGNQGWFYPLHASTLVTIDYTNYTPPGRINSNDWGLASKGYIYSSTNTTIQFRAIINDGMVIYFNNSTVINRWGTGVNVTDTSTVLPLRMGFNPIKLTYFQDTVGNRCLFSWAIPAGSAYTSNGLGVLYHNNSSKFWP